MKINLNKIQFLLSFYGSIFAHIFFFSSPLKITTHTVSCVLLLTISLYKSFILKKYFTIFLLLFSFLFFSGNIYYGNNNYFSYYVIFYSQIFTLLTIDLNKILKEEVSYHLKLSFFSLLLIFILFLFNVFLIEFIPDLNLYRNSGYSDFKIQAFKGFTINPNVSTFPFIFILLFYYYYFRADKIYLTSLFLLTVVTIFTYSRGNYLLLVPLYYLTLNNFFSKKKIIWVCLFIIILIFLFTKIETADFYLQSFWNKLTDLSQNQTRIEIFKNLVDIIITNPFGYGYNYYLEFYGKASENSFLEIAITFGVIPLFLIIFYLFYKSTNYFLANNLFKLIVIYQIILINMYNTYILFTLFGCFCALIRLKKLS